MLVRARHVDHGAAPAALRPYLKQVEVAPGKEYEVHAAVVFEGRVSVLVVDDLDYSEWLPAWLFDVVDSEVPSDWICSIFHEGEPSMIIGPAFIASSIESYAAMVELELEQVNRFWKRIDDRRRG